MSLGLILTAIFVIAKITGYVDWTWLTVFIPTMIEGAVALLVVIFAVVLSGVLSGVFRRKIRR